MGISECGTKVFAHVRSEAALGQYSGQRLVVDLASFKLKYWYGDVPHYYRPTEPMTHGYKAGLARLLSALTVATGSTELVTVVLDGGRFPPKAREHARRSGPTESRAKLLKDAEAKDAEGEHKEADKIYGASSQYVYRVVPVPRA